jgi:hypothetical protein
MNLCDICHKTTFVGKANKSLVELERLLYTLDLDESARTATKTRLQRTCEVCINFMINDMKLEMPKTASSLTQPAFSIVDERSREYDKLSKLFYQTMTCNIIRIEKNNNHVLYKRHLAMCQNDQIKYLFHGSNNDNYIKIMTNGFDINLSKNGLLGKGIYFSDTAVYSHDYTNGLDLRGTIVANMLICRVYLRDDTKHGFTIHCVQHQDLGYPEYVIYYEQK